MIKTFFDIHCHAMNMSHPCISAFIKRFTGELREITVRRVINSIDSLSKIKVIREFFDMLGSYKEAKNLLGVMENDCGNLFLLMQDCLYGKYGFTPALLTENGLLIDGETYKKMVLTPLIMDFGYDNSAANKTYYACPAKKPVTEQIIDVLNGIRHYARKSEKSFFEIYPFLGINTKNFSLKKLEEVLNKCFGEYRHSRDALFENFARFDGNIDGITSNYFAGIKVYPPMGFDPWPAKDPAELEKVKFLYWLCESKNIPVTSHCNDEGFAILPENEALGYTSPDAWACVLKAHPKLKLNLAHFGHQSGATPLNEWSRKICELIYKYDGVYSDFAFNGVYPDYYETMKRFLDKLPEEMRKKVYEKILFGSDFMMNLLKIESYSKYLSQFSTTQFFSSEEKERFASINPQRFLFK